MGHFYDRNVVCASGGLGDAASTVAEADFGSGRTEVGGINTRF